MKAIVGGITGFLTLTSAAAAQDLWEIADNLGYVIASEKPCGLSYDQEQIARFIDENVPGDAMDFPSSLQGSIAAAELDIQDNSPSAMTAHCRAVTNIARHYGLVE